MLEAQFRKDGRDCFPAEMRGDFMSKNVKGNLEVVSMVLKKIMKMDVEKSFNTLVDLVSLLLGYSSW